MAGDATLKMILLGEDRSASKALRGVGKETDRTGGKLAGMSKVAGRLLVGGLLAGGAAMVKFGHQASDLAETQSKVTQVFGKESTAALDEFASSAAQNLGQSKQVALDAAATFGIIGKAAGKSGEDLVDFSTDMTTLAGDMASFNNATPEEAIVAIGAAMRGESEPIRKYGVLLDDATLRNRALKMGLIDTVKNALTPQQKALAAQAEILAQTSDQQGDFARTSEGLANKQRILKAEFANLSTELGAKALPILLKVTAAGLAMMAWIEQNEVLVGVLAGGITTLVAAVWAINAAAKAFRATQMALNIVMSANPIGLVVVAIGALVAAFILAYKNSETFRDIVNGAWAAVAAGFKFVWNNILAPIFQLWGKAIGVLLSTWAGMLRLLGKVPGMGWAKDLAKKLDTAAGAASNLNLKLDETDKKKVKVKVDTSAIERASSLTRGLLSLLNAAMANAPKASKPTAPRTTTTRDNAIGTAFFAGGVTRVGERGPEFVELPRGSSVATADQSRSRANGGSGDLGTLTVVVQTDTGEVIEKKLVKVKRDRGGRALAFS